MNKVCPISLRQIDATAARITAYLTVTLLVVTLLTLSSILAGILVIDFALRATNTAKASPFARLSKAIVHTAKLKSTPTNAGPKQFAAQLGFLFSTLVLTGIITGAQGLAYSVGGAFLVAALLEAFFGFCVACKIYPFFHK